MGWLHLLAGVQPELELLCATEKSFDDFVSKFMCHETIVQSLRCDAKSSGFDSSSLDAEGLNNCLKSVAQSRETWHFLFVNKFVVRNRKTIVPKDANKLRISREAFEELVRICNVPVSFVYALSTHYLPHGHGHHQWSTSSDSDNYGLWYILPVRVQVHCTEKQSHHVSSVPNNDQMDPYHYIHLPDAEVDIRGSCIAVYSSFDASTCSSVFVMFNFLQGRWAKVVEEPERRVAEAIHHSANNGQRLSPYFLHLVYVTSVSRWWTNVMSSLNYQLLAHEATLQQELESDNDSTQYYARLDRALHSIAAHLHRYQSELSSLSATITTIAELLDAKHELHMEADMANRRAAHGLSQVASEVEATTYFSQELEKKLNNTLALVSSHKIFCDVRIDVLFNRMQIANTRALNTILHAIQIDTETSQRLTEETRKDSLSMKTIAIVTMFFLPGASIAALLSMPFMENTTMFQSAGSIWLWFALTIPTTGLVFMFYIYYKRQSDDAAAAAESAHNS